MRRYRPLFVTSLARSGSYLVSMLMSANKDVTVASEPYLELFRSMRNAFMRQSAPADMLAQFDPSSPMQDYYFTDDRLKMMDIIRSGDLETPFQAEEWESFHEKSARRAELQCAELVPHLAGLRGRTYRELFDNGLELIARTRNAHNLKWVGIKDTWTIEFFAPLARTYPDAKFVVILRDPRAIINSMLGIVRTHPEQVAHVLSYARHWRKYIAFVLHYRRDPLMSGRFHVLTHESVLREPERTARGVCDFLEVEYDPSMLDTSKYHDYATGEVWKGNSSFEDVTKGISIHRAERWRTTLPSTITRLVEFVCWPEMTLFDYEPTAPCHGNIPDQSILEYVIKSNRAYANWRCDLGDPQHDWGFELFRHAMLFLDSDPQDASLVRRSFLFEEAYEELKRKIAA